MRRADTILWKLPEISAVLRVFWLEPAYCARTLNTRCDFGPHHAHARYRISSDCRHRGARVFLLLHYWKAARELIMAACSIRLGRAEAVSYVRLRRARLDAQGVDRTQ